MLNNIVTLKPRLGSLKIIGNHLHHSIVHLRIPIRLPYYGGVLYRFEIKWVLVENANFYPFHLICTISWNPFDFVPKLYYKLSES